MGFYEIGNGCDTCATIPQPQAQANNMMTGPSNNISHQNNVNNTNALLATLGQNNVSNTNNNQNMNTNQNVTQQVNQQKQQIASVVEQVVKNQNNMVNRANSGNQLNLNIPSGFLLLNIGLVVFSALACNECVKYFINKAIQLDDGSPMYYVGYAIFTMVLAYAVHSYLKRNPQMV